MKYMKILVLFCLLLISRCPLFAAPWGVLINYFESRNTQAEAPRQGERFLLSQILAGQPVRISLSLRSKKAVEKSADYEKIIAESYAQWFRETAQIIRRSGREKEFSDILPLLDRGISVKFVYSSDKTDILFFVWPLSDVQEVCGSSSGGCYMVEEGKIPCIFIPQNNFIQRIASRGMLTAANISLHEIGHSLGLSDQYEQSRSNNSHPVYSTEESRKSIMNKSKRITCDDADGMINLIDLTLGIKRGGMSGWHSLCKDSDILYVNGVPNTKGPYAIILSKGKWRLDVFQNGRKIEEKVFPLDLQGGLSAFADGKETVLSRDKAGRPVFARGDKGEDIYYSYSYDRRDRLAVLDGKTVQAELLVPDYKPIRKFFSVKWQRTERLFKYFGENGSVSAVGYIRPFNKEGKEGVAVYWRGVFDKKPIAYIELEFDKEGRIIRRKVTGDPPGRASGRSGALSASSRQKRSERSAAILPRAGAERELSKNLEAVLQNRIAARQEELLKEWYLKQP